MDRNIEDEIKAAVKTELSHQRGLSPTVLGWMRFLLTPVFLAFAAFLWYLGVVGIGDIDKEIALAATNFGTAIGILVATHWFPQLAAR